MRLVNVGCGRRVHPAWCNLDLSADVPGVTKHDLRRGIPFENDSCDAVYHSHVLEHLTREDGRRFLAECYRVLKPGGVLRVVVPDLERIASGYLAALSEAEANPDALTKVDWMKIEMFDQVMRTRSGGEMARFVKNEGRAQEAFIRARIGDEVFGDSHPKKSRRARNIWSRIPKLLVKVKRLVGLALVSALDGKSGYQTYKEALFRQSGELHRWMYDRVTLKHALQQIGFAEVAVYSAESSRIAGFNEFGLDCVDGRIRKPDSLFMEGIKPVASSSDAMDARRAA